MQAMQNACGCSWRLTFEFVDGDVHVLDYEDYH
jgi:plasmid maintenance system killer protein